MACRISHVLSATLLLMAVSAAGQTVYVPLDPDTLGGPGIFTAAQSQVAQAAKTAGLDYIADPRPLPPQVILPLDTAAAVVQRQQGLLFWRGDMLPDQLAPAETGTLYRKQRDPDGTWKLIRTKETYALASRINLQPVARSTGHFTLPRLIIETPYHLGSLGGAPVALVLWRTTEEDSLPLGGAIVLSNPPVALLETLKSLPPPSKPRPIGPLNSTPFRPDFFLPRAIALAWIIHATGGPSTSRGRYRHRFRNRSSPPPFISY